MKNSTKFIFVAIVATALLFNTKVSAQTSDSSKWRLGFGLESGLPTGNMNQFSNFELGGTARLQYSLTNNLALTFTSGYYNFFSKRLPVTVFDINGSAIGTQYFKYPQVGMVPIKLGIKSFFSKNFYWGAEAGAGIETQFNGITRLLLSPSLGWASKSLDVGVRYEYFSGYQLNNGMVAVRIAYGFKL
jgi:hypothetical protein